jgi:hypothetical protein
MPDFVRVIDFLSFSSIHCISHAAMASKHDPPPLSGGDRKALNKELRNRRA